MFGHRRPSFYFGSNLSTLKNITNIRNSNKIFGLIVWLDNRETEIDPADETNEFSCLK